MASIRAKVLHEWSSALGAVGSKTLMKLRNQELSTQRDMYRESHGSLASQYYRFFPYSKAMKPIALGGKAMSRGLTAGARGITKR
mmetsp:Transcript_27592/g.67118  ORF Transcript_27592/g.67118 Transcript_27592/m.67118 type:complete len:85 (-) Transcript_27592:1131-1385(-)